MNQSLTELIKEKAGELGFEMVGVTSPDPPPHLNIYSAWIDEGMHGDMGYLATDRAIERRADPKKILPECRSILVLGVRHEAMDLARSSQSPPLSGRVAAYAWGEDYHEALKPLLKALVSYIEEQVGGKIPNRWYTDTGPILERELAQRAGLGWIGKNTCLIHPRTGSYYLLAEVLLGIDLDPDEPFLVDHCGTCTRCIEACPTACILPDRTIDARECISYLTIELKGPIPLDLRPRMGNWVFGCDICQEVCPWNIRFSRSPGADLLAARDEIRQPDLRSEIQLDQESFSHKFSRSPVKRPRREGYLRNVAVALGNSGDGGAVPGLCSALGEDPSPLVRGHAAWALGLLGGRRATEALEQARFEEADEFVLGEIQLALEYMRKGKGLV